MTDDGGVLGNLPRSRPGKRSEKRASAGARPSGAATKRPSSQTRRRLRDRPGTPPARRSNDPVGEVIRGAAKAAETGVRVAGAVAQEVLRRVPRP